MTRRSATRSSLALGAALLAGVLLLSGCSEPSDALPTHTFPTFGVPQEAKDQVTPNNTGLGDGGMFDPSSTRYAGAYEDLRLYIAVPNDGTGICIIASGARRTTTCSDGDWVGTDLWPAEIRTINAPGTEDWTALSDSLIINE